jgi:hypothetical protein
MANALQFIESNIEDLDKEEVQIQIEKKFIETAQKIGEKYNNIGLINKQSSSLTFDQMRLIEEILLQADIKLKELIDKNIEGFLFSVKESSKVKGIRWDDIVNRFEY